MKLLLRLLRLGLLGELLLLVLLLRWWLLLLKRMLGLLLSGLQNSLLFLEAISLSDHSGIIRRRLHWHVRPGAIILLHTRLWHHLHGHLVGCHLAVYRPTISLHPLDLWPSLIDTNTLWHSVRYSVRRSSGNSVR